jgi:uncharacterized phage-associated protein
MINWIKNIFLGNSNCHSIHIANYFINRAFIQGVELRPFKLASLVYIAYGWNFAFNKTKLFKDPIEVCDYNPVIPELYRHIRIFSPNLSIRVTLKTPYTYSFKDSNVVDVLNRVWESYEKYSTNELCEMISNKNSPWYHALQIYGKYATIPDILIYNYYSNLLLGMRNFENHHN